MECVSGMSYYQILSVGKNTVTIPLKKKYRNLSTTTHFTQVKNTTKDRNYFIKYLKHCPQLR
jgi:DnaJ-class molecular chaperone